MWRSIWRSFDRFSSKHFKHVIAELHSIKFVDASNREVVIDLLQAIVEVVTYGDKQDPMIFELFMEYQVMGEFVRMLKISKNARIEASLLQYLSILIQNMENEQAIYYCLSNGYINMIIVHDFNFQFGDLASYYVSFLRAVSSKLNRDTLCLLVKVNEDAVVSFPLYTEALKFCQYGEKMIQTAVRALTLNIYNVSDSMIYNYITTPPASNYFSDLVQNLKEQCFRLDGYVYTFEENSYKLRKQGLLLEAEKIVDDLYYLKDILSVGERRLTNAIMAELCNRLLIPISVSLVHTGEKKEISTVTSLYLLCLLVKVLGEKDIVIPVADNILHPGLSSSWQIGAQRSHKCFNNTDSSLSNLSSSEVTETFNGDTDTTIPPCKILSQSYSLESSTSIFEKRTVSMQPACYDDPCAMLAFIFLLLTLVENSESPRAVRIFLANYQSQILNALLKILGKDSQATVFTKWHVGWFLRKFLISMEGSLSDSNYQSFAISFDESLKMVNTELEGFCFDRIPETLRIEWLNCKKALEKPFKNKDPQFVLELPISQLSSGISDDDAYVHVGWQSMVDSVKVFVLHLYLKTLIFKEVIPDTLLPEVSSNRNGSRTPIASDTSSATFGSEISLGTGIPCRIAISKAGIRDIYIITLPKIIPGKLLLAEKHPFRTNHGLVIAIAPLASLNPKIDNIHTTWLRLTIREFDLRAKPKQTRDHVPTASSNILDGKWTLGFSTLRACEEACSFILQEIETHRTHVRSLLSPLLQQHQTL